MLYCFIQWFCWTCFVVLHVCSLDWLCVICLEHACIEMCDKMILIIFCTFLKKSSQTVLWTYICCDKDLVQSTTLVLDSTKPKFWYRFCEHVLDEILRWKEFQSAFSCVSQHCDMHIRLYYCSVWNSVMPTSSNDYIFKS